MVYYVLQYRVPLFGWDSEDAYDLDEVKDLMESLKEDYGEDLEFRAWKMTKKQLNLKEL